MDGLSLERIPLPSFSFYSIFTVTSFIFSAARVFTDASYNRFVDRASNDSTVVGDNTSIVDCFLDDTWCFWSIINFSYWCIMCVALTLQSTFFGKLREEEQIHIRDKFWNFVFYKLVFIYGILNVQTVQEILLWIAWSSVLGFLHLLSGLTKDRCEFIIQAPDTSSVLHLKMACLLVSVLGLGNLLSGISLYIGIKISLHIMLFMFAEVLQLLISTAHVVTRYAFHFYVEAASSKRDLSQRCHQSVVFYYVELVFSSVGYVVDFIHNLHMLLWNSIQVNMSGIIICMHLQYLYYEISKRFTRHQRYLEVAHLLENNFALVQRPNEPCAVCWETLSQGRLLACGHIFHDACLRSWIAQNANCPACRARVEGTTMGLGNHAPTVSSISLHTTGRHELVDVYEGSDEHLENFEARGNEESLSRILTTSASTHDVSQFSSTRGSFSAGLSTSIEAIPLASSSSFRPDHSRLNPETSGNGRFKTKNSKQSQLAGLVGQLADELIVAVSGLRDRRSADTMPNHHSLSATVIMNSLVDTREELSQSTLLEGASTVSAKLADELEANLLNYLEPSDDSSQSSGSGGKPSNTTSSSTVAASTLVPVSNPLNATSINSEPIRNDRFHEPFSPKQIVRQAIRQLFIKSGLPTVRERADIACHPTPASSTATSNPNTFEPDAAGYLQGAPSRCEQSSINSCAAIDIINLEGDSIACSWRSVYPYEAVQRVDQWLNHGTRRRVNHSPSHPQSRRHSMQFGGTCSSATTHIKVEAPPQEPEELIFLPTPQLRQSNLKDRKANLLTKARSVYMLKSTTVARNTS